MSDIGFKLETMIPMPAASSSVRPIITTEDGVLLCYGSAAHTVLEAETDVYAPGCLYIKSLTAGSSILYVNEGTRTTPDFDAVSVA
jgi:hypothetical protein